MGKKMDGRRVRSLLASDTRALVATYRQFEELLPAEVRAGAEHRGEDGRFVEALVRSYLRPLLPRALEVATGFIMRPAVKTGLNGRERAGEKDAHSGQLDVLVIDSMNYPVFKRFDETVIVPPEAVIGIVSVKKHLRTADIGSECEALRRAAELCRCLGQGEDGLRGPFLALAGMSYANAPKTTPVATAIFKEIDAAYSNSPSRPTFDGTVGLVGTVDGVSVFKKRPESDSPSAAEYFWIRHRDGEEHWTLQLLLTGLLSVYFDRSRNRRRRPGFSGFESGRLHDGDLGKIAVSHMR